jgi:general stress protein 26
MKRASSEKLQQLQSWIRGIPVAMLTTEDRHGQLRSRPMVALDDMMDDALWFFSDASSQKIDDIHGHHAVNLCYADPSTNKYVSVTGRARLVRDRERMRSLWRSSLRNWFSKEADDPELVLLKVEVIEAEMWQSPARQVEVELNVNSDAQSTHELLTTQ